MVMPFFMKQTKMVKIDGLILVKIDGRYVVKLIGP